MAYDHSYRDELIVLILEYSDASYYLYWANPLTVRDWIDESCIVGNMNK